MRSVQRKILLRIIKGFKTISFDACCVLSENEPIDLVVYSCSEKYKSVKKPCTMLPAYPVDKPLPPSKWLHPASVTFCNEDDYSDFDWRIYTDGSKLESGETGCGVVIYQKNDPAPVSSQKFRLAAWCSNNQAEMLAVLKALQWLLSRENLEIRKTAKISTDSQVTLDTIHNLSCHLDTAEQIRHCLQTLLTDGWTVQLHWVKSHVGIEGNEAADTLAKEAASDDNLAIEFYSVPISYVNRQVRQQVMSVWQDMWDKTPNGSHTKKFFPTVSSKFKSSNDRISFKTTQVLSGHGKNKAYLHRFHLADDEACSCSLGSPQTWEHLIYDCQLFEAQRSRLIRITTIQHSYIWPVSLRDLAENFWDDFVTFVNALDFDKL